MGVKIFIEDAEPNGRFYVTTMTDDGKTVSKHRGAVEPGRFVAAGTFEATDLSRYPAEVQEFAARHWTDSAIVKWKTEFPWVEPVPPPPLENISKNIIWERMTDQEAIAADNVLKAQSVKIRRIYDGATYISVRAAEYPMLLAAMVQLFGAQRAADILKPNF